VSKYRLYLLLIYLIVVWALSWPVAKIGLEYISPLWFSALRLIIATACMFIIVMLLGKLVRPTKQDLPLILSIGFFQVALFMVCINVGLLYVDAGRSAILVYTTPLWVVPISIFFLKEKGTLMKWLGFIFGMVGIAILFNPFEIDWSDRKDLIGNGVLLLAALSWAIAMLCARHMRWTRSPVELIPWQLLMGAIIVTFFAFLKEPFDHIVWNHKLIAVLLYCSILATAIGYWGMVEVSKELPPITTSLSLLLTPVLGLIFSTIMLHEVITTAMIIAMCFTLGGVICVVRDNK